jgi:hypothetical protein
MIKMPTKEEYVRIASEVADRYQMTEPQRAALRLCVLWSTLAQEVFPEYNHYRVKTKGDPRDSHLFRLCWKLLRETKNMIKDDQYDLYIRANLEMLRTMHRAVGGVRIDPQILVGDKAWIRWKMWKRKFDKADKAHQIKGGEQIHANTYKVSRDLQGSADFLEKAFGVPHTFEQISEAKEKGDLRTWLSLQKISPYYILLSPFCRQACGGIKGLADYFPKTDFAIYRGDFNPEVLEIARRIFKSEFLWLAQQVCKD